MTRAVFAIPGDIDTRTGGYIYDRRVMELLPARGIEVAHLQLPASFPFPQDADMEATQRALQAVEENDIIIADGLAWGAVSPDLARGVKAKVIALCHHPLGLEAGLSAQQSEAFIRNERDVLSASAHVIVTSKTTAKILFKDFAVPREKISVAEPGTDRAPRATGGAGVPHILAVGSVVPRKGYDVLVEALASIAGMSWHCTIVGSQERATDFAANVRSRIATHGLEDRIEMAGECAEDELEAFYNGADIFVSASHYEGYGMVLSEALVRSLAIVTSTGGAAASTVPDEAALKVPPGDATALADALKHLLEDETERQRLSDNAWKAAERLPRWEDAADIFARVIRAIAHGQRPESLT